MNKLLKNIEESHEPEFVKLYLQDIGKLFDLDSNSQRLFGELIKLINPKDPSMHNLVVLNRSRKDKIATRLGWDGVDAKGTPKKYYINNYLIRLCKSQIIKKLSADMYIVNPFICSKVNWENTELLRSIHLSITYDEVQRTLITMVEQIPKVLENHVETFRNTKDKEIFKWEPEKEENKEKEIAP